MPAESPKAPAQSSSDAPRRFIARQPILDCEQKVYAYELLFRATADSVAADGDNERATLSTLDLSLLLGADFLTEGLPAFINCTREVLCSGILNTLPKENVVLEILEDVPADEETVRECRRLKQAGYRFALDDVISADGRMEFFDLAEIIKVDFLLTDAARQRELAQHFGRRGIRMLAEKVETHEQFRDAMQMGYTLFQGYFFCRPVTMAAKDLPSTHLGYLQILRKVYQPELDYQELAKAIREEPALCYRLLRYLNSAAFGVYRVNSIVHALNLLGRDELRKWVSLVTTISLAGPHSAELLRMALARARFCELYAQNRRLPPTDFFLTGLFSLLDAIMDRPLSQIIDQIPISAPCRAALGGECNQLRLVLDLSIAGLRGEWEQLPGLCQQLTCSEMEVCQWLADGWLWVREMTARKNLPDPKVL